MKKIELSTTYKKLLADVYTPVGIYLRLRDRFRDTVLLESTDFHVGENSFSIIGINAIAGIEISNYQEIEFKLPSQNIQKIKITNDTKVADELWKFMQYFAIGELVSLPVSKAQGLFGYITFDAIQFFEEIKFKALRESEHPQIPLVRYRLYQYVIVINHFKDELFICENHIKGIESEIDIVESLIKSKDVPAYPFAVVQKETSSLSDEEYMNMVKKGIASCARGDVFQVVLSRKFRQKFSGDEFNVYRALRNINPSPYLFYFDYGDYRLFGSSPESQLIVQNNIAVVHPIAGTFKRTGNDAVDEDLAEKLAKDEKENAEHVMLVDLARNDLSRLCNEVKVTRFCEVQYFSHVIHLVSEVKGKVPENSNPFDLLGVTFPAGTLSGAPKYKAMQLIDEFEKDARGYYGGCIGFVGFNGSINHAIMIRTFLSKQNNLIYRAGAGIVAASNPTSELQEVTNKLNALTLAIKSAEKI
ncbi:anthranilate synthase component I family protein [Ginsengibacter hankyongi]|uniref:Anthranilate synthase component 1 n=1 Tax=Ginsengibacter hankyongi TaxID=2607284 RepID=A0A5J5ILP6_9BACT|nr:anthranilate synthase component I family protein [Ginsengibacter hankyongi]KAA9041283.1 anthranilate synthase component I family protein [Ginsengibacter hankyongi]